MIDFYRKQRDAMIASAEKWLKGLWFGKEHTKTSMSAAEYLRFHNIKKRGLDKFYEAETLNDLKTQHQYNSPMDLYGLKICVRALNGLLAPSCGPIVYCRTGFTSLMISLV